jgi:hypothetical protein
MPLVTRGHIVLAHYPDGSTKILTLHAEPRVGQVIAHGWKVIVVSPVSDGQSDFEIVVERPLGAP